KAIKDVQKKFEDAEEDFRQKVTKMEAEKKQLQIEVAEWRGKAAAGTPALAAQAKAMADPHALMLDISSAKPLWDEPLGKIIRVVDANSALARIASLYAADGYEIPLNDPNLVRRQSNNAMSEGDLLFNMAWGTHIAIAGPINWTGLPGDSGNDQSRHLQAFI